MSKMNTTVADMPKAAARRNLRWSDVNGLALVLLALGATIVATGLSEAKFQKTEAAFQRAQAAMSTLTKTANCESARVGGLSARPQALSPRS